MAFKLTRTEQARKDEIVADLRSKLEVLETLLAEESPDTQKIQEAASLFTVIVDEAETFRDEIATRLRDEFDEKSERWQESDKAEEVIYFIEEWENIDFSCELDILEPDTEGLENYADDLDNLPIEA